MSLAEPTVVDVAIEEAAIEERAMLKQDVHTRLVQLRKLTELGVTGGLSDSLDDVNRKIERYNELVPDSQRRQIVSCETFVAQIDSWE
ncbi:hypothetical protein FE782_21470 [Paenibacillus antri]|uniref:Uncharacterized protein n=1 Tax=Paenibacillus antri TaxID=2582848 RepID=A0A5R9GA37_9BACL|nr:hypothetical protein [Paenibacillus antri]TLS50238.1 hypothetical protein FE782_21470 [Paenibacillus antri]